MTSPKEVREYNEREALIGAFATSAYGETLLTFAPVDIDGGIRVGNYEIFPGQDPLKPVIRTADTKRMMAGTGKFPKAVVVSNPPLPTVKQDADKETYRAAFERLFPTDGEERGSLAYAFEQFWMACEGSPQYVECPHEGCGKKHVVAFKKDAGSLYKIIELGVGRNDTKNVKVDIKEQKLTRILEQRTLEVKLSSMNDGEVQERRAMIIESGFELEGWDETDGYSEDSEPSATAGGDSGGASDSASAESGG